MSLHPLKTNVRKNGPRRHCASWCSVALVMTALIAIMPMKVAHAESQFDAIAGFETEIVLTSEDIPELSDYAKNGSKLKLYCNACPSSLEKNAYVIQDTLTFAFAASETIRAGKYEFTVLNPKGEIVFGGTMTIFPDVVQRKDLLRTDDGREPYVGEGVTYKAGFFDTYGNETPAQLVLLSSDATIETKEKDDEGYTHFTVKPKRGGEITLTLTDAWTGETITQTLTVKMPVALAPAPALAPQQTSGRRETVTMLLGELIRASLLDEFDRSGNSGVPEKSSGLVDLFSVKIGGQNSVLKVNELYDIEITALDSRGAVAKGYVGEVVIESTDTLAELPAGTIKFYASDLGRVKLPLAIMFSTPGRHQISVHDYSDDRIGGEDLDVWVVGHGAAVQRGSIVIENPVSGSSFSSSPLTVSGMSPAFINLELVDMSMGAAGTVLQRASSTKDGTFSFSVALDSSLESHILVVKEGEGGRGLSSEPVTVVADTNAPEIGEIALLPASVGPGGSFLVSLPAKDAISGSVRIGDGPVEPLTKGMLDGNGFTIFEARLKAPESVGSYTVTLTLSDGAGNDTMKSKELTVEDTGLAQVTGLKADVQEGDILLSWNGVSEAKGYRVYFGPDATNLTEQIDTESTASSARITGLKGGSTYVFAVTALDEEGRESVEKSNVVAGTLRGSIFYVQAMPVANGANLQWIAPLGSQVKQYRIQYGVQSGRYTEQRVVDGSVNAFALMDLINGVTYYMSLAAEQHDGSILSDAVETSFISGVDGSAGIVIGQSAYLPESIGGPWREEFSDASSHGAATNDERIMPQSGPGASVILGSIVVLVSIFMLHPVLNAYREKRMIAILRDAYGRNS